jgi:two-component system chemotaxis response regulator CheB
MKLERFVTNVIDPVKATASPIRVLVVDDSAFMRKMVTEILMRDAGISVVGQARDGADALVKLETLKPDVITLDIEMPVMDGISALTEILKRRPTPVLMLSSLTQAGADATIRCLELGAVDFIGKPSGAISLDINKISSEIIGKVISAAGAKLGRRKTAPEKTYIPAPPTRSGKDKISAIFIGASTGGPRALQQVIPLLPANIGVPIVVVQHMPVGFTKSFAARLEQTSPFSAREAEDGDRLRPGEVLVAPGGRHLVFDSSGVAKLTDEPPVHGVRPAIDVTLASLVALYGGSLLAALLTGMGKDGARALKQLLDKGGFTLAEDETTCVVYGMPKAAVELGAVRLLLPLSEIAPAIVRACKSEI